MTLGWSLTDDADYKLPYDAGLTPIQEALFQELLEAYAPSPESIDSALYTLLQSLCRRRGLRFNEASAKKIVFLVKLHLEGYSVFSYFLQDDDLEEIAAAGLNQPVFVCHRTRGWLKTNVVLKDLDFAVDVVNKMSRSLGRRLTYQQPRLSAVLDDGSRLHACMEPIARDGFALTLRKFRRARFSVKDLVDACFLTKDQAAFLWMVMESDASLLIAGNTASGKTTLLNALSSFVNPSERIVVVEEAPELQWLHEHQVRLVECVDVGADLKTLVWDSLRMRPDRVVLGEARTAAEAKALFDVLLSGHAKGAYATFHADSASETLTRLTSLGVRAEDLDALDIVAVTRRSSAGRKLVECAFVDRSKTLPVFSSNKISRAFFSSRFFKKLGLSKKLFIESWKARASLIDKSPSEAKAFEEFVRCSGLAAGSAFSKEAFEGNALEEFVRK